MLEFDYIKLFIIISSTILLVGIGYKTSHTPHQRLLISLTLIGLFFYSGIATADKYVPVSFLFAYIVFAFSIISGFLVGKPLFIRVGRTVGNYIDQPLETLSKSYFPHAIISIYLLFHFLHLVTPDFRAHLLFNPPPPDIRSWFFAQFEPTQSALVKILGYLEILFLPFFYIALFAVKRVLFIAVILAFPLYFQYVSHSYIGRYEILFNILFLALVIWYSKPNWRPVFLLTAIVLTPVLFYSAYAYTQVRLGASITDINLIDATKAVMHSEFSFLIVAGLPLLESGKHINMIEYVTWIFTLPIPGFLKAGLDVSLINYEISEIVLGRRVGDDNFYVVLSSPLAESFYIFGNFFFWLHGVFIGLLASFFVSILERSPKFRFLFYYVCLMFFFNLNRGGIASILPPLVNGFLVFFVYLLVVIFKRQLTQKRSGFL